MINCYLPLTLEGTVHLTVNNPETLSVQKRFVLLRFGGFGVFVSAIEFLLTQPWEKKKKWHSAA